jgi:hypothetical protein
LTYLRTSLSKKVRFEVFKRDSFTCQYCGHKAPDVLLEVDHVNPVSKGGADDILNLITACKDCNSGKAARRLSDSTVLNKQRGQLERLQDRREQIDMMFQWQKELARLQVEVAERIDEVWLEYVPDNEFNQTSISSFIKLSNEFSAEEVIVAIRTAAEQYLEYRKGKPTSSSVKLAFQKIGGICRTNRLEVENPGIKRIYYIRGIIRKRFTYCNENLALELLQTAQGLDGNVSKLEESAKTARNWSQWRTEIETYIQELLLNARFKLSPQKNV